MEMYSEQTQNGLVKTNTLKTNSSLVHTVVTADNDLWYRYVHESRCCSVHEMLKGCG